MATLKDIADKSGLSAQSVSRILNGQTKNLRRDATARAQIVLDVARKMNYRPNAAARSIRSRRTHQVGVLLRNAPDNPLHYTSEFEFILGINQCLESANYVLSVVRMEDVPNNSAHTSRVFRENILDGMIVISGIPDATISVVKGLMAHCVFLDTNVWEETNCLRRDEVHSGRVAAQAMVDAGYRRLVWACAGYIHFSHAERFEGIRQIANKTGVQLDTISLPEWMTPIDTQTLRSVLSPDTAVITSEANNAVRIVCAASQMGLCLGKDFSIASCDQTHDIHTSMPDLSCVSYDRLAFGRLAGQMLLKMLKQPDQPCLSRRIQSEWFHGRSAPGPNPIRQECAI